VNDPASSMDYQSEVFSDIDVSCIISSKSKFEYPSQRIVGYQVCTRVVVYFSIT
jgi:hypothetical protein